MNFEDTYSRMHNDELLRLTSEWKTLTESAQVALANELEKRKLGNEFKAERQIALEKPLPSSNRGRRSIIAFVAVFAFSSFYFLTKEDGLLAQLLSTSQAQEPYNGSNFTMVVPSGSTPVKVQSSTQPVGEQQMIQNAYSFRNSNASYRVVAATYSEHVEGSPEEASRATASAVLEAGYSANFSPTHLGALSAVASELEGTTVKGKAAFIRTRLAFSDDRKHMWMVIVVVSDRQSFPKAQAEAFMDSIQVSAR